MAAATSGADTKRPMGCRARRAASSASGSSVASSSLRTHGVSAVPGLTQLTLIPSATWSAAMAKVNDRTAPFVALYSARLGKPAVAAIEQVLTITAEREARRGGRAAAANRPLPDKVAANTPPHSSSGI